MISLTFLHLIVKLRSRYICREHMNILKITTVALAFFTFSCITNAEDTTHQHPIDVWLDAHMSDDYSTAGMRKTTVEAQEMWDKEMNVVYRRLMSKLSPNQRAILRESQRNWIKFSDSEGKVILEIIAAQEGTIHQLMATGYGMDLVRERTLKLIAYEKNLAN